MGVFTDRFRSGTARCIRKSGMIRGDKRLMVFFTGDDNDASKKTPIQNLIFDIVNGVDARIRWGYMAELETINSVAAPDMLIMVTANIFANLSHHIMNPLDTKMRLELFKELQDGFNEASTDLFLALQTYFSDFKSKN